MKKSSAFFIAAFAFVYAVFAPTDALAEDTGRSYLYRDIDTTMRINKDTTFDVVENQWFEYHGEYHQGYRSIPLTKIDDITDIRVIDGETGNALSYSANRLNKADPSAWGRYTSYRKNGAIIIEWYYNLKDTSHHWRIAYKVHGGVAFYDTFDEVYWNILTDYDVPVQHASVSVILPQSVDLDHMQVKEYLAGGAVSSSSVVDGRTFTASATNLKPKAAFTIAAGWPKGVVDERAYWADFIRVYLWYLVSAALVIITALVIVIHWFFTEKFRKGRGTIIAQYEPPQQLPPAMGEVIVKEGITKNTWAATIVDLAVRGLVIIEEEAETQWEKMGRIVMQSVCAFVLALFTLFIITAFTGAPFKLSASVDSFFQIAIVGFIIFYGFNVIPKWPVFVKKDYILTLKDTKFREQEEKYGLKPYETDFLGVLFDVEGAFLTRKARLDSTLSQRVYKSLKETEKKLYEDLAALNVYAKDMVTERKWKIIIGVSAMGAFVLAVMAASSHSSSASNTVSFQQVVLTLTFIVCAIALIYRFFFDARLNDEGNVLREEWLGFKLYLETAERYRMQNLTPDIFEKYLPYAMIFSIEKQWAKSFESINMRNPEWYSSAVVSSSGFSGTTFSASSFASGLSASLSSSLSSAGASGGGASGGGGGAGGGGGGGGGGAS